MRTFVAIELSDALRARIRARMEKAERCLPKARWVNPDLLHLTLVFLGQTDERDLAALEIELQATFLKYRRFELKLAGSGTFPPRRSARVAWIGADGGEALPRLQDEVAATIGGILGRSAESRAFHAHVTLARCRQPWKSYAVDRFHELMGDFSADIRVQEGVLMASQLGRAGSRYTRVCNFALGGS